VAWWRRWRRGEEMEVARWRSEAAAMAGFSVCVRAAGVDGSSVKPC
jgi:hypothetical protein